MDFSIERAIKNFKEIAPGELAGPCPECGGALRLRVWPEKGEYACIACPVKGWIGARLSSDEPVDLSGVVVHIITSRDGRTVHITDNRAEYARLVGEGKIVFTSREINLIKRSGADPETAARFLDVKQEFPGAEIEKLVDGVG